MTRHAKEYSEVRGYVAAARWAAACRCTAMTSTPLVSRIYHCTPMPAWLEQHLSMSMGKSRLCAPLHRREPQSTLQPARRLLLSVLGTNPHTGGGSTRTMWRPAPPRYDTVSPRSTQMWSRICNATHGCPPDGMPCFRVQSLPMSYFLVERMRCTIRTRTGLHCLGGVARHELA